MDEWRKEKGGKEKQRIRWEENTRAAGRRKGEEGKRLTS